MRGRISRPRAKEWENMTTTAWKFNGTERADEAVLKLTNLNDHEYIDVQDIAVLRWPQYAPAPLAHEHANAEVSKASAFAGKLRHTGIDASMIDAAKGDMTPGTSVLVVMSSDSAIDTVAQAFQGQDMELIRSDLSVQQQDHVRAAFSTSASDSRDRAVPPK
jgi:uncharacterized membrane protein